MTRTLLIVLICTLCAGCVQPVGGVAWTPRAKLVAHEQSFTAAVNALAVFREDGAFNERDAQIITGFIQLGQKCLIRWHVALEMNEPVPASVINELKMAMRELIAARIKAERGHV